METESLTSYNSNGGVHLMQKTVDKGIVNSSNGLDGETNSNLCDEHDDKICTENESEDPSNILKGNSNRDDNFDSDVEEEEEHVPLNLETTSDLEKSDDDLDDRNEQNNCDSDNEEKEYNEPDNDSSDPLDVNEKPTPESETTEEPDEVHRQSSPSEPVENVQDQSDKEKKIENGINQSKPDGSPVDLDDGEIDQNVNNTTSCPNETKTNKNKDIISHNKSKEITESDDKDLVEKKDETQNNIEKDSIDANHADVEQNEKIQTEKEQKESDSENIEDESDEKRDDQDKPDEHETQNDYEVGKSSLLKETLMKKTDSKEPECEDERDDDMDEALFDPSLLCPDIFMEVDEAPVITTNDAPPPPPDGNKSPLLYEPIFSTFVDEMTGAEVSFNLSAEEENLRQETFGESNPVQYTKIHCTACNVHLGSALDGQGNRFVHPLLKVLICKNCYHFYTSGEFEKDEDGSELYCRWCGQGGQVMCCSNCEMVFCKKCIRINFDKKKLSEIRDSDDWLCFRCNPSQLTFQRIHCAEFMEYVRREISRAATLDNATSFMTKDNSECCLPQKKKATDTPTGEPKKKKKKTTTDPDYDPFKDREEIDSPQPSTSGYKTIPPRSATPSSKTVATGDANKSVTSNTNAINSTYIIATPTFKPRTSTFQQARPRIQVISPGSLNAAQRPKIAGPGYIKILPGGIRVPGNTPTPRNTYPARQLIPVVTQPTSTTSGTQSKQQPGRNLAPPMKHEWFEKTVRAAARVNSNLSYTLTQLNRAQANAANVEALAVVHNKLQEILSTSINSLIQIRKNLRTEFISGIKNIRFPPAAAKPATPVSAQKPPTTSSPDDDIIFISPPTSPVPPPLKQAPAATSPPNSINLPSTLSLIKKSSNTPSSTNTPPPKLTATITPITNKSSENNIERPKTFLRVKSLTALQNVTSECITIPDDPLPPPPPLAPLQTFKNEVNTNNDPNGGDVVEILDDEKESIAESTMVNGADKVEVVDEIVSFDLNAPHSKELQRIMRGFKVILEKSTEIEELIEKEIQSGK